MFDIYSYITALIRLLEIFEVYNRNGMETRLMTPNHPSKALIWNVARENKILKTEAEGVSH